MASHADALQQQLGALARLGPCHAEHAQRGLDDIVQDAQVREELEILEDHAEQATYLAQLVDIGLETAAQRVWADADRASVKGIEAVAPTREFLWCVASFWTSFREVLPPNQ